MPSVWSDSDLFSVTDARLLQIIERDLSISCRQTVRHSGCSCSEGGIKVSREAVQLRPSWIQVVASVAAAFFGVQSAKNRERDFTHGNPWHFLTIGVLMTAGLVGIFYTAVLVAIRYLG